jgi:hypothetical protein
MMGYRDRMMGVRSCVGTAEYWGGLFNGVSFPDLQEIELHHTETPATRFIGAQLTEGDLRGLAKVTRLVVERAPELTSSVLISALPYAPHLKQLVLKELSQITYQGLH